MSDEIWRDLPQDPEPERFEERSHLLTTELGEVRPWLDLGCGAGRFTALAPGGIGVDIAEEALKRARKNVPKGDFRRIADDGSIPVGHGEVGFVWCSEVIEHVPDALGLLQEARRVLKPGGRLLITTPGHGLTRRLRLAVSGFDEHFDPMGDHLRFFTESSLAATLTAAGFTIARMSGRKGNLVARAVRA